MVGTPQPTTSHKEAFSKIEVSCFASLPCLRYWWCKTIGLLPLNLDSTAFAFSSRLRSGGHSLVLPSVLEAPVVAPNTVDLYR